MKRFITFILVLASLMAMVVPVYAADTEPETVQLEDGTKITYFGDGGVLTTYPATIVEESYSTLGTAKTITAAKDNIYEYDGVVEWKYTLTASFTYTGDSSVCTSASYTKTIYKDNWQFSDGSTSRSGNRAYGYGTFKYKVLFVTTKTVNIDISMFCTVGGVVM